MTFAEVKDKATGPLNPSEIDTYEVKLKLGLTKQMIKTARKARSLAQKELGELNGIQKVRFHGCRAVRHDDHIHLEL